jgi:hypothetical protein
VKCEPSAPLRADVVYRAPSGRLCRWVPLGGDQRQVTSFSFFEYLRDGQQRHGPRALWADGFVLAPANYQLLREEHDAAAR